MPEEVQQDQNEQQPQADAQSEGNVSEEVVASTEPQEPGDLPETASERTKAEFEKLKEANKRLKEELDARSSGQQKPSLLETYLDTSPFQPPVAPQMPQMPQLPILQNVSQATAEAEAKKLYDEQGYVDANELDRRLSLIAQAEARAKAAEDKANKALERVARFEIDSEKKLLHAAYPELDPSSDKFNPKAFELVRDRMLGQLVETGQQNAMKAADEMSELFRKPQITPQQQQTLEQRSQATSIKPSGTASAAYASDFDELRKKSMTSDEAMDERIRRAGI
jgi:hypothetical protein